jgi:hypothetical protein
MVVLGLSASLSAGGFSVRHKVINGIVVVPGWYDPNHELITEDALSSITTMVNGKPFAFSAEARAHIAMANMAMDSLESDTAEVHFDENAFIPGATRLRDTRLRVVDFALRGLYISARANLGSALHSVQDFYAHSSWVEMGRADLAPLDDGPNQALLPPYGPTCTVSGLLPSSTPTSGYFSNGQLIGNISWVWEPGQASGWCIHGSPFVSRYEFGGAGLNKDTIKRGDVFFSARALAVTASTQYVNGVISGINSRTDKTPAQRAAAVCGLLGARGCLKAPSIPWRALFVSQLAGSYGGEYSDSSINWKPCTAVLDPGAVLTVAGSSTSSFNFLDDKMQVSVMRDYPGGTTSLVGNPANGNSSAYPLAQISWSNGIVFGGSLIATGQFTSVICERATHLGIAPGQLASAPILGKTISMALHDYTLPANCMWANVLRNNLPVRFEGTTLVIDEFRIDLAPSGLKTEQAAMLRNNSSDEIAGELTFTQDRGDGSSFYMTYFRGRGATFALSSSGLNFSCGAPP